MWIAETIDLDDHDLVVKFMKNQSEQIKKLENENEQLKKQRYDLYSDIARLVDENEQLKQQVQDIYNLIDKKIEEYAKYDGYDTEKFYIGTQLLKDLKKGLKGDVE